MAKPLANEAATTPASSAQGLLMLFYRGAGHAYVILDGTLIPIDRVAADRPFYSDESTHRDDSTQAPAAWRQIRLHPSSAAPV